jgi:hypothetical protein
MFSHIVIEGDQGLFHIICKNLSLETVEPRDISDPKVEELLWPIGLSKTPLESGD